ncbi:MAG: rhodanese-like domain-containing protein [Gammaproteobacteria bacterium]|nr:rhodanese-like domain-containing protein [Gammaproteobacteria bacterium]
MQQLTHLLIALTLLGSGLLHASESTVPTLKEVKRQVDNLSTSELKQLLEKQPDTYLIDVRTAGEVQTINEMIAAKNNINIPRGWLELRIAAAVPDKNSPIVVYCGTGQRSPFAADTLKKMGYQNVTNYDDGFFDWQEAELPVTLLNPAPDSLLFRRPQKVIDGVYSAIGATAPGGYNNSGHNNNLSFIISDDGVLVVNAGDNYLLAKSLHEEIKKLTDQPVKYVVLENGQGHAMLGSNYWREQGVPIIAHTDTVTEIKTYGEETLDQMRSRSRDKAFGTELVMPDQHFGTKRVIQLGSETIELLNLGPAHSPGDTMVWLPKRSLIITGDMAFHQRMLPVFEHTDTGEWIKTWDKFAALKAKYVIPGHGMPTDMDEVTKYTRDYLLYMRSKITEIIDNDGTLQDAYAIDQSAYSHLPTFDILAKQNAGRIFRAMEFE